MKVKKGITISIALGLSILSYFLIPGGDFPQAPYVGAMVVLMAVLWITEVIPIPVTSLFPLFLLPILGVLPVKEVSVFYGKPIIFLFLGGFLLAIALQKSGLHKRIALKILAFIGDKPAGIVLGFFLAGSLLSMWISNTASVMVMLPVGLSILNQLKSKDVPPAVLAKIGLGIMLAMAYGADIGGMATPVGTPPNLVFQEMYKDMFPLAPEISFVDWMMIGLPISILFIISGWLLLTKVLLRLPKASLLGGRNIIRQQLKELGKLKGDEKIAGFIFALTALLWMSGSDLRMGEWGIIHGWRSQLGLAGLSDAGVAILMASILFVIPSKERKEEPLLVWADASQIPWGILLLFGGGFAIAGGFTKSGLSDIIGQGFAQIEVSSPIFVVAFINTLLTFLTEITSNTAMTNLVLPILGEASVVMHIDPRLIMIPATLSASCAFMMPIASPTQAIVFASGHVPIREMMRIGIWFNVLGVILVTLVFILIGQFVLGIDVQEFPDWAMKVGELK